MEAGATPSLTRLLSHFAQQRSEKHRYRQNIQARWNQAIPAVELERAGENCLYQMEAMAKKWISADEALTLVAHMAITRIQEAKYKQQHNQHSGGRGLTKQLTTKDWTNARSLSSSDAIDILRTSRYTRSDLLECLDANVVEWIQCHLKIRDHTAASHPLSAVHDHTARPREPEVAEEHNRPAVDDIAQTEAYSSSNRDAHQLSNRISEEPEQLGLGLNGRAQDDAGLTDWLKNSNMVMCDTQPPLHGDQSQMHAAQQTHVDYDDHDTEINSASARNIDEDTESSDGLSVIADGDLEDLENNVNRAKAEAESYSC